jgi:SAM-dependent methyltransferase
LTTPATVDRAFHELEDALGLVSPDLVEWNRQYFVGHRERYRADLCLVADSYRGGPLLEVGSLPCHMTFCLRELGYPVVGVDLDPSRAEALIGALRLDVRQCDIERDPLPFGDESMGFVLFAETFEHLRLNPIFTLSEISRVLEPGGVMVLTTPQLYSASTIARLLVGRGFNDPYEEYRKLYTVGHMGHVRLYSTREVRTFLSRAGFEVARVGYRMHHHEQPRALTRGATLLYGLVPKLRPYQTVVATKSRAPELSGRPRN